MQSINSAGLKHYMRHICSVTKKSIKEEEPRKKAVEEVNSYFGNDEIKDQLAELKRKVSTILDNEFDAMDYKKREEESSIKLREQLDENKQSLAELRLTVEEIKKEVETILDLKYTREKRIKVLENKIESHHKKTKPLSKKLNELEQKYKKLKSNKQASGELLNKLKEKIDSLKLKTISLSP